MWPGHSMGNTGTGQAGQVGQPDTIGPKAVPPGRQEQGSGASAWAQMWLFRLLSMYKPLHLGRLTGGGVLKEKQNGREKGGQLSLGRALSPSPSLLMVTGGAELSLHLL